MNIAQGNSKSFMKSDKFFLEQVMERLLPHGPIRARAMFGGYGIYYDDVMFASIVENRLYFRVDEKNQRDFEKYKSEPFVYCGGKRPIEMPYKTLPEEIFNNPKQLKLYIQNSYEASLRYKLKKKPKKKKSNAL